MVAPAATSKIFLLYICKKKAYNGLKKYKSNSQYSFVLFKHTGKASNIFDYELKY